MRANLLTVYGVLVDVTGYVMDVYRRTVIMKRRHTLNVPLHVPASEILYNVIKLLTFF